MERDKYWEELLQLSSQDNRASECLLQCVACARDLLNTLLLYGSWWQARHLLFGSVLWISYISTRHQQALSSALDQPVGAAAVSTQEMVRG
jgi:hypothetical protein